MEWGAGFGEVGPTSGEVSAIGDVGSDGPLDSWVVLGGAGAGLLFATGGCGGGRVGTIAPVGGLGAARVGIRAGVCAAAEAGDGFEGTGGGARGFSKLAWWFCGKRGLMESRS